MSEIIQYRPAYVSGFDNSINEFYTKKDLLQISWVNSFSEIEGFYRFSIEENKTNYYLMAEYKKGKEWWVIGIINKPEAYLINEYFPYEMLNSFPKFKSKNKKQYAKKSS